MILILILYGILLLVQIFVISVLVLMFVSSVISNAHGAPYVPINRKLVKSILTFGGLSANDIFYDLGCGDGRILAFAIRDFRVHQAVGYEISPWPYIKARFLMYLSGLADKTSIVRQNFLQADLSNATFVCAYLFPKIVDKLAAKLAGEMKSGTKVLCLSSPINTNGHNQYELLKSEKIGKITAYLYEKI